MAWIHAEGKKAEDAALEWFLERRPVKLLARNYRWRGLEIDLVFEEWTTSGSELVFVEVRLRALGGLITGLESVQGLKRRRMVQAAQVYLSQYQGLAETVRYDLLVWDRKSWEYYPNLLLY